MGGEETLDGFGILGVCGFGHIAGGEGLEEFEEFIAGAGGEAVGGMGDDVGVAVLGKVEANGHTAGVGVGVGIGDNGDAGGIGEADGDGSGGTKDVGSAGEGRGILRWGEVAGEEDSLGVSGAEAGVEAEDGVELGEEFLGEGENRLIGGERHGEFLSEVFETGGP
jgi:hypothetical protein